VQLLPDNFSTTGGTIDHLFYVILWITGIAFVVVQVCLLLFVILYRARPGRTAAYIHGSTPVEIIWTVVPTIILVVLGFASQGAWANLRERVPANATRIEILAEQFAWNIRYPGPDEVFNTEDDVTTINQLHVPVNQPVVVHLRSKDVIHSFFLPLLRVKQDAVPGLTTRVWFEATQPGQHEIACAELCGLGHYRMRGFLTLESPEAWQAWLTSQGKQRVAEYAP